jgi:hypothetical protein
LTANGKSYNIRDSCPAGRSLLRVLRKAPVFDLARPCHSTNWLGRPGLARGSLTSVPPVIRWTVIVLTFAATGAAAQAQPSDPPAPAQVSLERIRAGLARPSAIDLSVAAPAPDFHVEVEGRRFYRDDPPLWETWQGLTAAPPSLPAHGSPALVQVDLLGLGRQAAAAVSRVRRARAARAAHAEAEDALREFCADRDCDPR